MLADSIKSFTFCIECRAFYSIFFFAASCCPFSMPIGWFFFWAHKQMIAKVKRMPARERWNETGRFTNKSCRFFRFAGAAATTVDFISLSLSFQFDGVVCTHRFTLTKSQTVKNAPASLNNIYLQCGTVTREKKEEVEEWNEEKY